MKERKNTDSFQTIPNRTTVIAFKISSSPPKNNNTKAHDVYKHRHTLLTAVASEYMER